ncbi:pyrroline-5-carboxylate reductase [Akkermansiaceae bacterium]|nr:pyrroline-5-carboxylate reductase [Akkermansiaceae bacterium]
MNVGIVGCGKMGQALTMGALRSGALKSEALFLFDPMPAAVDMLKAESNGAAADSLETLIDQSETLIVCVKPAQVTEVLAKVKKCGGSHLVLSIAAGVTLQTMEAAASDKTRVIRIMPNTPALVGLGASAYSPGKNATDNDSAFAEKLLSSVGIVEQVPESLMDAVTGLSGSGPAYIYTMIEALADGGLLKGLPREQALRLATQTALGAAKMVSETNLLPAELRDRVTSPGGTTIAGLAALEKGNFRSTVISAVSTATERSQELGGE